MNSAIVFLCVIALGLVLVAAAGIAQSVQRGRGRPARDALLVCPHCGTRGLVRSQSVKRKRGISGGKATGAVLTGGVSVLATGLSRKERATRMDCGRCGTTWYV